MNISPPPGRAHARGNPPAARAIARFVTRFPYDIRASRDTALRHTAALRLVIADLEAGVVARGREIGRKCSYRLELSAVSLEAAAARDEALLEQLGPEGERLALEHLAERRRQEALFAAGHFAPPTSTVSERAAAEAAVEVQSLERDAELELPDIASDDRHRVLDLLSREPVG